MPTYSKKTWASEEVATSTGLNQMSDNIELSLRGKVSNRELATGTKDITILNGQSSSSAISVTFSSDSDDGDPNFSGAPIIWTSFLGPITVAPNGSLHVTITNITTTGCTLQLFSSDSQPADRDMRVRWFALGVV